MESSLPFAVRVAVGLVSESLGALRRLPTDVSTLPVTVIGKVAKLSFQLNQQLTDLATSGDHLLATLQKPAEPPERTAWSTIDDEDEVAAKDPQAAATWDSVEDAAAEVRIDDDETASIDQDAAPANSDSSPLRDTTATVQAAAAAARRRSSSARRAGTPRTAPAPETSFDAAEDVVAEEDSLERGLLEDVEALESEQVRPVTLIGLPSSVDGPATNGGTTDVGSLTLAELRGRVRSMPVEQVRAALEHEQTGKARPAFLTLLTNRLSTLARGGE